MKVSRLPVDPGPAAWNEILPPAPDTTPLEQDITADWLVIGAGFAGLSAARRLLENRPKDRIVVLEAKRVAEGPAGRNSGFMIDLPHDLSSASYSGQAGADRRQIEANRAAIEFAASVAEEFGLSREAYVKSGKINAAASEKGLTNNREFAEHIAALGEPFEMLDAGQMQAIAGTPFYQGGLYTPGTAMIQPALYIRGLADGVQKGGVQLYENTPVLELAQSGPDWSAVTPKGKVTAPKVVLAVNGHVQSFGQFKGQLMHTFTYASMTRALTSEENRALGGEAEWGVLPAHPMGTTVRRISGTGGDRIVVRNRFTCDPSMVVSDRRIANVGRDHDRAFKARFPMLKSVSMQYRWGGRLCLSRNNVPAFGEVDDGVFSAACQNGLGTAKGTLSGMMAADLACAVESQLLVEFCSQDAPVRFPPDPLLWIGANAVMRWGQFRAGSEF